MTDDQLTEKIIGCTYKVHNTLGPGFLEKVYENGLRIELEKQGLSIRQQEPISVTYDGQVVGEYYADLWVEQRVVEDEKLSLELLAKGLVEGILDPVGIHPNRRDAELGVNERRAELGQVNCGRRLIPETT